MMAINLQLVVLPVVVTLNHYSCMVSIFSVLMPNIFYDKIGCIWFINDFFDILININIIVSVPLMPIVLLIVNYYVESFRVFCFR